jgi:hypothetical protein
MNLRVIEGGLSMAAGAGARPDENPQPDKDDVAREATRRLGESGYHLSRLKEFAIGVAIPLELRYLKIQIDFAAAALSRLDPIPADFRSDGYWPRTKP